jgi:hypothetical protein
VVVRRLDVSVVVVRVVAALIVELAVGGAAPTATVAGCSGALVT